MVHKLTCYRCKSDMWLPDALFSAAQCSDKVEFFCPYGHGQIFALGETEEATLRRERDRLKQALAQRDDTIANLKNRVSEAARTIEATRKDQVRLRKRAGAGVCPDCNRQFQDMYRHIRMKHPNFKSERIMA